MTTNRSFLTVLFISMLFLSSCERNNVRQQSMINDLVNMNIIQRYLSIYPSLKVTGKEQKTGKGIIFYKCSVNDTTRIIVDQTCTIKELLTFGLLYAYVVDEAYVFSNFKLFHNLKSVGFDSAAAQSTEDYYRFIKEETTSEYFIDCFPYKPLRIIKVKDRIINYEFSYGFLPDRYFIAIMKKKLTNDRYAWYKKRVNNF
jgi:hypothetical protein